MKKMLLAATITAVLAFSGTAQTQELSSGYLIDWRGMNDAQVVDMVNSVSDEERYFLDDTGNLPEAPQGYTYAEDLSIVPLSFYQ